MRKLFFLLIFSLSVIKSYSQWNTDTSVRNPVTLLMYERDPLICRDGDRGYYIAWQDDYNMLNIKLQRVDTAGYLLWLTAKTLSVGHNYYLEGIVSDDSGGVYVIGSYTTAGAIGFVDVQRIDQNGDPFWGSNVNLIGNLNSQYSGNVECIPDGQGGLIVAWDWNNQSSSIDDVYAQRIDRNGNTLWGTGPFTISTNGGLNNILSDGQSGVVISFFTVGGMIIQHVDSASNFLWGAGVQLSTVGYMFSDGMGGSIYTYDSVMQGTTYIYFQHLDSVGTILTPPNGLLLFSDVFNTYDIMPDNQGNFFFSATGGDLAQSYIVSAKINSNGVALWTDTCSLDSTDRWFVKITSDGLGGSIAVWEDLRYGNGINTVNGTYYSQHYDANGTQLWADWGYAVSSSPNLGTQGGFWDSECFDICTGTDGSAIAVWEDSRTGAVNHNRIYMARVDGNTITGISEINTHTPSVYPNPVQGNLKISFHRNIKRGSIAIFTSMGNLITRLNIENENEKIIDLSNYASGLYNICSYDGETQYCSKVIVD